MESKTLQQILERYGTRTGQWPPAAREALPLLLRTDPVLRAAWAEAQALDGLLDLATPPPPDPGLATGIVARAQRGAVLPLLRMDRLWRTAALLLLPALLGVALGLALPSPFSSVEATSAEEWSLLAYGPQLNGEAGE